MEYELTRSRRRTVCVKIERDGRVRVMAPLRMPKRDIEAFVEKNRGFIVQSLEKVRRRMEKYPPLSEDEKAELFARAEREIPPRVEYYADVMGVEPKSVRITRAEVRYGSCSGDNGLCFSYRLMRYPQEAVDYVIVHELAHITHKNHGPDFYREIYKYMPDYRRRAELLK